ncbi:porin [Pseudorhizobium marinum]|uniref:porin n=1 Tax=Pseudorhizobium marinum TaxID=1496690 RepID=UPI000495F36B|nr:porin [Pseudorhizobium marinum]
MNIKSLLLGSAAALAAVSGAQAADAIIAAEPEPMEYVRVCDAFGTGYFYIPGTETCLKIDGYVRFQVDFDDRDDSYAGDNWDAWTRARVNFTSKSDTELGELTGYIGMQINTTDSPRTGALVTGTNDFVLDEVYLQLGGFKAGTYLNWWDKGINGETDSLGSNRLTSIAYIYTGDAFTAGIQLDEISRNAATGEYSVGQHLGLEGIVTASLGAAAFDLLGSYDFDAENGAVRAIVSAGVGPGTLQLAGIWSSGQNIYYDAAEWTIAASYAFKATEKFTLTPGVQYFNGLGAIGDDFGDDDGWRAGLTVDYAITRGMSMKVSAQYNDRDGADDYVDGFVRLQRSF